MNWYYAAGGQQQGPVDDAQLDALIAAGTVRPDTLVWREGMANWQALRDARSASASASQPAAAPSATIAPGGGGAPLGENEVRCGECGGVFTRDNAIQYGSVWVCAACKPRFLQKLREGAPAGGSGGAHPTGTYIDPATLLAQTLARNPTVDFGRCLGRAWELLKSNFWLLIGATAVNTLCQGAASGVPFIGWCLGMVLQGPLLGGLYVMFLRQARNEGAAFGDAFSGFSNFLPLMLGSIVSTLLLYAFFIPAAVCFFVGGDSRNDVLAFVGVGLAVVALPFVIYLAISWTFTYLLIMDRKYDFWTAMNISRKVINKCWWGMLGMMIVLGLLQIVGALALCVGIFVTLTLLYAAVMYAYEDIFQGGTS